MEGCREKETDLKKREDNEELNIHKRIRTFIDRLDFPSESSSKISERFFKDDDTSDQQQDVPNFSVLFNDASQTKSKSTFDQDQKMMMQKSKNKNQSKNKKNQIKNLISISKKQKNQSDNIDHQPIKTTQKKKKIDIKRAKKAQKKNHPFLDNKSTSASLFGWKKKKEKKTKLTDKKTQNTSKQENIKQDRTEPEQLSEQRLAELKKDALDHSKVINPDDWQEIDFYELYPPFVYISVMRDQETKDRRYLVLEQQLTKEEKKQFDFILEALQTYSINVEEIEGNGSSAVLQKEVDEIIEDYGLSITESSKKKIMYTVQKNLLGFGKINPLMKDPHIEDISCDGAGLPIFIYHRDHGSIQSNIQFVDEDELSGFVMRLAQKCGKHISIAHPMIDATMPDGSRIQMTLSTEVSTKGSTFTIRKFREQPFSPTDLIRFNSFSSEMIAYFWLAVEHGVNGLIAGGTAAGKTSTLNAMALFIPRESKIVSIEETREINLPHPNWIPGVSRSGFGDVVAGKMAGEIDLYDLMKAALRQRPEYILVGEIRGREAYVLFQAMATGHTTYSTVHADSTKSLIHRLEGEPINIPRIMLQSLDVVCLQTIARVKNKRARRCKQVIEIIDIDPTTKEILTNEVFRWDPIEDTFSYSGKSYILEQIRSETNQSREEITAELKQRAKVLEWMVEHNIHLFDDVAHITAQYQDHPDEVMKKVKGET